VDSTSPEGDGKRIAKGANIRRQSRTKCQRVEDNAFHLYLIQAIL
jgi:hypothetical protein